MNINASDLFQSLWEFITFEIFVKFLLLYFFIIWIAILLWVIKDISNRTNSVVLQIFSILTILFLTPLGVFIYLIIRPSKTLFEKHYEEIEDNLDLFNKIIEDKNSLCDGSMTCFKCNTLINHDFKFCTNCKVKLKKECRGCGKVMNHDWTICPYCGKKDKKDKKNK